MVNNKRKSIIAGAFILLAQMGNIWGGADPFKLGECPFGKSVAPEQYGYAPLEKYSKEKPLYGSPKKLQKVLVHHNDTYRFGYIQEVSNEEKKASVVVVDRDKATEKAIPVPFDGLYIHPLWLSSYSCFAPTIYTDISFDEWFKKHDVVPVYDTKSDAYCPLDAHYFYSLCEKCKEIYEKHEPEGTKISKRDQFYVQKLDLSEQSYLQVCQSYVKRLIGRNSGVGEKKVVLFGDIHGDIKSFMKGLANLKRAGYLHNDFSLTGGVYFLCLGDYVDRGPYDCCGTYSTHVLYTLFRLKQANPERVFLIRGNHEKASMNKVTSDGFDSELCRKMGYTQEERDSIYSLYNLLPVAMYIQSPCESTRQTLLCCHGLPEIGFYTHDFLESYDYVRPVEQLDRLSWLMEKESDIDSDASVSPAVLTKYTPRISGMDQQVPLGFCWDDIDDINPKSLTFNRGRGFCVGATIVRQLLDREGICSVVRGHQHSDMATQLHKNKGCVSSCNGRVTTLISGKVVSGFKDYSYAIWKKAGDTWRLQHIAQ